MDEAMRRAWVDATVVARHLRISGRTVRRLASEGRLPSVRVGCVWRFRIADVEAALMTNAEALPPTLGRGMPEGGVR